LTIVSWPSLVPSPWTSGDGTLPVGVTSMGILLLGTRVYENTSWLPHNLLSCCRVASSSLSKTSTKFAAPKCDLPYLGFFQHWSSECPNPAQKEHLTPQFSVLWDIPHLAHFGRGSLSLGHAVTIWSPPLQI
jgi:hypothetical protein